MLRSHTSRTVRYQTEPDVGQALLADVGQPPRREPDQSTWNSFDAPAVLMPSNGTPALTSTSVQIPALSGERQQLDSYDRSIPEELPGPVAQHSPLAERDEKIVFRVVIAVAALTIPWIVFYQAYLRLKITEALPSVPPLLHVLILAGVPIVVIVVSFVIAVSRSKPRAA